MDTHTSISVLGLGNMGTAFARAWLTAGHRVSVWNRTSERARALAAEGAYAADTAHEIVAKANLLVVCLLDDASVASVLDGVDLSGVDVVNLTTNTPDEARTRAAWIAERGGRLLDAGVMAVPGMVGVPGSGAFVLYSGPRAMFDACADVLKTPAEAVYVGEDVGHAALYDVALLSAMTGLFGGLTHAYALMRGENVALPQFTPMLVGFVRAMAGSAYGMAAQLSSGDHVTGTASSLAMQLAGAQTLLRTAHEQGVDPTLLTPYVNLMARHVASGHGNEGTAALVDALKLSD